MDTHSPRDLMMIGASLAGGVPPRRRGAVRASRPEAFAHAKQTRRTLCALLQRLREEGDFDEAFVWDTCQRIELYGWLRESPTPAHRAAVAERVTRELFGEVHAGLVANRLAGRRAWYHLRRTACGLNSRLPGDLDVTAQLETAVHRAQSAGSAGTLAAALLDQVREVVAEVGRGTHWGCFRTGYCRAALARLRDPARAHWDRAAHVVIGGSTTSHSILTTLVEAYRVPQRRLTLVYRGYHGHWKLLREALGAGRRLRVQAYTDPAIQRAIADADVVFFGLDVAGPILEMETLRDLRDFRSRPLTLIDFNSLGSIGGSTADGITLLHAPLLDEAVTGYAAALRQRPDFRQAACAADRWIRRRSLDGSTRPPSLRATA